MHRIIIITAFLSLVGCKTQEVIIEYDIPSNLTELERNYILADLETGRMLYKEHCAKCHGIYGKAEPGTPDFSKVKIILNLEIVLKRAVTRDPIAHKMTRVMLPDEVNRIMGFIDQYKIQPQP